MTIWPWKRKEETEAPGVTPLDTFRRGSYTVQLFDDELRPIRDMRWHGCTHVKSGSWGDFVVEFVDEHGLKHRFVGFNYSAEEEI